MKLNWLKKAFGSSEGDSTKWQALSLFGSGQRVQLGFNELLNLYLGWTYICISALAEDVGNINLHLYKKTSKGLEEVTEHEVLDLLYKFNNGMTKSEGFAITSSHLDIFGRSYWRLIKDKTGRSIVPLIPTNVQEIFDDDGILQGYQVTTYTTKSQRKIENVDPSEIIPFRFINPFNLKGTYSPMQGAAEWLQTEYNATMWNKNFFDNNAIPTALLKSSTPMSLETQRRLKMSFDDDNKGMSNAHNIGVLPAGVELLKLSENAKDMDFVNLDKRYQDKILSMFKMPRTRIGITDDVNRANAEATNYIYALRGVLPRMQKIVDALNEFLPGLDGLILAFDSPVPEDDTSKNARIQAALSGQPYMSINEAREEQGLDPVDGGDSVMTTFNYSPLGTTAPDATDQTTQNSFKNIVISKRPSKVVRTYKTDFAKKVIQGVKEILKKDAEKFASKEMDAIEHKAFIGRNEPVVEPVRDAVLKVNARIAKDTLAHLAEFTKSQDVTYLKALLDSKDDVKAELLSVIINPLSNVAEREAKHVLQNFGINGEYAPSTFTKKKMDKYFNKLGKSYAETTITEIKDVIDSGLKDGLGLKEIKRNLNEQVFDGTMKSRAEMIARTEVYRYANLGLKDGYVQSGVVKTIRWYTAEDERVCEYCEPMDGKTVATEEVFFQEGQRVIGKSGGIMDLNYSDIDGGNLHPQCRCYIRPDTISIV